MKGFKLKLSEALGFHGLTAKLVEEEMNDKGHNRASEEKLVKVREREGGREGGRERGRGREVEGEGVQRSWGKGVVKETHEKEDAAHEKEDARERGSRGFVFILFQLYRRLNWDHAAALVEGWIPRKYANNYHLIF